MKFVIVIISLLIMSILANAQQITKTRWEKAFHIVKLDKPFPLARYRAPDPFVYADQRSHCAQAGKDLRICKTISGAKIAFIFELKGTTIGEWPTSLDTGGDSKFEVLKGDLDEDRIDEIVIANLAGTSNGVGIHTWTISIFQNPQVFGFQPPLEFSVQEFGARGTFIRHPGDRRCQILVTEWQYLDHPKAGNGMYLIGRLYNYREGSLIPIKERPTVVRRYLYGFAEHVAQTREHPGVPLRWFKNLHTETVSIDPAVLGKETATAKGVIKKVEIAGSVGGYRGLRIKIDLDSGRSRVYQYSVRSFEDTDEYFFRFGSGKAERIYPEDYNPKSLSDWLIGTKVNIAAYELSILGSRLGTRQIIWLLNR